MLLGGRGVAQDGRTPLYMACQEDHEEVVKLLLADERVDVNQAEEVRVGGEGERRWRERVGRAEGCGTERRACHGGGRQELTSAGRLERCTYQHRREGLHGDGGSVTRVWRRGRAVEGRQGVVLGRR